HLTALDNEFSAVNIGLKDGHGAIIEIEGIGIVRRTTEEFNVEWAGSIFEVKPGFDLGALDHTHAKIVKGGIVIHVGSLGDQAIIRNHQNTRIMGLLENVREGRTVDRCNDEHIRTLGDHVFDLGKLVGDV